MVAKTWRPVSTQSRSTEGGLGDEKHDFGGQVQEIKCTVSSYESTVQKAVQVSEGIDLEGRATPSADDESLSAAQKHSVTVKAGASLMRFIRGKGGATQRTIEEEMKVKIIIPFSRNEDCLSGLLLYLWLILIDSAFVID
uniref:Nucleic acid binding protein n=1 Tax=Solanum tuberosum TaxID=4113 RepID=M0ZRK4_SOLTU